MDAELEPKNALNLCEVPQFTPFCHVAKGFSDLVFFRSDFRKPESPEVGVCVVCVYLGTLSERHTYLE